MKVKASIKNIKNKGMTADQADIEMELAPGEMALLIREYPELLLTLIKAFVRSVFKK